LSRAELRRAPQWAERDMFMKTIVLYTSKTGSTKRYAEALAARLNCEAMPAKTVNPDTLKAYDAVVYGGWIFAGKISGLSRVLRAGNAKLTVFAVGSTPVAQMDMATLRAANALENTPLYYMEGGFHYPQLGWLTRTMLKMVAGMAAKKENATAEEREMGKLIGADYDHTDLTAIDPIVASLQP